jgi:hypothetical protein
VTTLLHAIALSAGIAPTLPFGWTQISLEWNHGPAGYFHDAVSGALVEYQLGSLWTMGVRVGGAPCKARAVDGSVPPCSLSLERDPKSSRRNLRVLVGPVGQLHALYSAEVHGDFQEQRARSLMLHSPLWERRWSGKTMLARDAQTSDLGGLVPGMDFDEVLLCLGDPLLLRPQADGGFVVEYVVWSHADAHGWYSQTRELHFSRVRSLVSVGPPTRAGGAPPPSR